MKNPWLKKNPLVSMWLSGAQGRGRHWTQATGSRQAGGDKGIEECDDDGNKEGA